MNQLQLFNNREFGQIRMVEIEGKPFAVGIDVARSLDYAKPSQAVIDHCKGIRKLGIPSPGGIQETNVIPEGDIYRLVVKAADQSKSPTVKEKAERFERWIFDEVIPSIRKNGMYAKDELLDNPELLLEVVSKLKEEREKRVAAEKRIEIDRPKVVFAEALETSNNSILIGELAKILKQNGIAIGQNRLFAHLRQQGYLGRKGEYYNMPTQRSMDLGLFEIKTRTINNPDGSLRVTKTPKVTAKGQMYFVNKFKDDKRSA